MTKRPAGTVTLLFTDVEGSTRLLERLGAEQYAKTLELHRRVLRGAFGAHGGFEFGTEGDAFFVAFGRAEDAVAAAAEGQRALGAAEWPDGAVLRVRMGVHTGEPLPVDSNYVGMDLHRVARIMSTGHGGQVVVSETTAALVDGAGLRDLGPHRLKDLLEPIVLYQLEIENLPAEFPPLRSLHRTNLPVAAWPLLGRDRELEEIRGLLGGGVRLLTLTGPGGSGKTRLALQVAAELSDEYADGVFFVALAPLRDLSAVEGTVAEAIGLQPDDDVAAWLSSRRTLLVLDNLEHLAGIEAVVAELLVGETAVLATSRAPLRLAVERELPVEPLPDDAAVELFVSRAAAAGRRVEADDTVAEVCRRLDCLPLAVELAAVRTKVLSPAAILERLGRSLPLLTGGPRDAPERQQTLQATIAWSHDLLSTDEQRLFAGLSVFAGGCTLEAAEQVCAADLDVLESLVDKSLLRHSGERFWMLETIREFALERMEETGEAEGIRHRHRAYFVGLAELAKPELLAWSSSIWFDRLEAEHDNLRAVLSEALDHGDADVVLRLGGAVWIFWLTRGYWSEGRRWLESALAAGTESDPHFRIDALCGAGLLAVWQEDLQRGDAVADELLALAAAMDSTWARAIGVDIAALVASNRGDWDQAAQLHAEVAKLARELGDSWLLSVAVNNLGDIALNRSEYECALGLFEESLAIGRERQDQDRLARAFVNLGLTTLLLGDVQRARSLLREGLTAAREIGIVEGFIQGFVGLGAAYAREDPARAARLIGRADVLLEETGSDLHQVEGRVRDETEQALRAGLGEDNYAVVYAEGRALALEDALDLALRPD